MTDSRPEQIILDAVERFGEERLALAASWQKETAVLVDLVRTYAPGARIFTLDTGALFDETYATWRKVEERYGITVEAYRGEWVPGLWATEPDRCCFLRKVEPLERALSDVDAWITGLRRDQSPARSGTPKLGEDRGHPGKLKCAPLAGWSERDVWAYIARHDLPYNPLHDQGYSSIGCTHCTLPGRGREGRWAGLEKTECGLHAPASR